MTQLKPSTVINAQYADICRSHKIQIFVEWLLFIAIYCRKQYRQGSFKLIGWLYIALIVIVMCLRQSKKTQLRQNVSYDLLDFNLPSLSHQPTMVRWAFILPLGASYSPNDMANNFLPSPTPSPALLNLTYVMTVMFCIPFSLYWILHP